jgi:hypothetical protein
MLNFLTGSVVLAALVTALVALQNSERNIKIQHVTGERTKWRDKVRRKALKVHRAAVADDPESLAELELQFTVILNPFDPDDLQILDAIHILSAPGPKEELLRAFAERIALLLKHDWERAKAEAAPFWKRPEPEYRMSYDAYRKATYHRQDRTNPPVL